MRILIVRGAQTKLRKVRAPPAGRLDAPEDVAALELALFLRMAGAGMLCGRVIPPNGGAARRCRWAW
jgi:hypothetical protein